MKVCFLSLEYPPNVYGGAGVHVANLTRSLARRMGVEVRCQGERGTEERDGVLVRRYPMPGAFNKAISTLLLDTKMLTPEIDADIVHAHTWYTDMAGLWAKQMYGRKLVATVHSLEPLRPWKQEQLGTGYKLSSWMERTGLEGCDGVIAVSESMKLDILNHYDIEAERVHVIPNGIDVERFYPRERRDALDRFGIQGPYILFVGRISRQKGIMLLLDAFEQLEGDVSLVLVTGAPDTEELLRELRARVEGSERIVWINEFLDEESASQLYTHAQVFVCPSRYEPFGIINLEAMACETPVVATRVGGIVDVVVDQGTGLLVEPGDAGVIARAVGRLLDDPELGREMGMAGRERVNQLFTWDRVAEQTTDFYNELVFDG